MLNMFKKTEVKEDVEVKKTWTIVLLKTSEEWYVNYMNNKLTYQIESNDLKDVVNVSILNNIWEIEDNIDSYGDYINVIEDGEISDNYVSVLYKAIKKCKKDAITFAGIFNKDDEELVFNQIEETDEEIFLHISQMNPIKKDIISKNILEYLHDRLISLTTCNVDNILVFRDHEVKHEELVIEEEIIKEPFSIILTAFQTQDFIEQCLDSIENQTYFKNYDEYEVFIGVDGCEDTLQKLNEIKDKYRNLSIYMMTENCGTYMTTNALLDLVKYENVIRFDTDDVMESIMIEEIVKFKSEDDDIIKLGFSDWVGGNVSDFHSTSNGTIYFKKNVMDDIAGGYQPWLCVADTELLARLKDRVNIKELNKRLFIRRIHDNSLSERKDTGINSIVRRNYQRQIKNYFNNTDVKIERTCNKIKQKFIDNKHVNCVSFCIPAYNAENYIEECLDSIYLQNCAKEILVGVDACIPTLLKLNEIKHKYENLKIFWFPKNVGPYIVKNTLAIKAKYEIISFFDSDDIMDSKYISIGLNILVKNSIFRIKYADFSKDNVPIDINYHAHGIILMYKQDFLSINGFYGARVASDLDFLYRCKNAGFIDIKCPNVLMKRRLHDANLSSSSKVGMNTPYRNEIHKEIENRNIQKIVKNEKFEIEDNIEFYSYSDTVSFCVSAYKAQNYIEECLDSIEIQNCKKEILVGVDNCKDTLNTLQKIRSKYSNIRIFWFHKNVGTSLIKNTLAKLANNNIISFFDSDDIMEEDYIEHVIKNIDDNTIVRFKFKEFNNNEPYRKFISQNFCANGAMSIYKKSFIQMNGFWEYRVSEDMDFINRWKIHHFDKCLSIYGFKRRIHNDNISYNEKTGCYGDFGENLKKLSKKRIDIGQINNSSYIISQNTEISIDINTYFDHVYCLNLDRREDKWQNVKKQFEMLDIEVERFSAVDGNNLSQKYLIMHPKLNKYEIGCMLSHYNIILDAKKHNYKRIMIFEDDVLFVDNFKEKFLAKISKIPKWKMFYLGATQWQWSEIKFIEDFYFAKGTDGTFAYAIDSSIYDDLLQTEQMVNRPIDNKLFDIQSKYENECIVSFPNLVIADVSDSEIRESRDNELHRKQMKWDLSFKK